MTCDSIRSQLISFLKKELDIHEQSQVEAHIAVCQSCRLNLQEYEGLWLSLDREFDQRPSSDSRDQFYRFLDSEISASSPQTTLETKSNRWSRQFQSLWPSSPIGAFTYSMIIILSSFLGGQGMSPGAFLRQETSTVNEIAEIQGELVEMKDLVTVTLLRQESIQARLRGVSYALQSRSDNPELIELLLNTVDQDDAGNVRLAALDALELHSDNSRVKDRLYQSLAQETSLLVQLRKAELLLNSAGPNRGQLLDALLMDQILDASVSEFLESIEAQPVDSQQGGRLLEL